MRTLLLCSLIVATPLTAAWQLTEGFRCWTFEAVRHARAARQELHAASLTLQPAVGSAWVPWHAAAVDGPAPLYVVDFIYTRCPGVCQALGSSFQQMQQALLAEPAPVRLLSISFDTAHDDMQALQAHARLHRADATRWQLAVPADAGASRRLLRSLGVIAIADGQGGFVHNAALHLVDGQGRVHALYPLDAWPQALAHARRIAAAS